ncbi:MAG: ABC transporter permease, partial [Fusobacteriaceae bacterium]|nr:ABC transporter permease [Fusobacteriaceae bacterium]
MLRMAFRNLKRNRRRTVLTISAIVIGIIFSTLILAWVNGAGAMMVEEGKRISGDIRLTAKDFILKEKALDTSSNISFTETKKLTKDISG